MSNKDFFDNLFGSFFEDEFHDSEKKVRNKSLMEVRHEVSNIIKIISDSEESLLKIDSADGVLIKKDNEIRLEMKGFSFKGGSLHRAYIKELNDQVYCDSTFYLKGSTKREYLDKLTNGSYKEDYKNEINKYITSMKLLLQEKEDEIREVGKHSELKKNHEVDKERKSKREAELFELEKEKIRLEQERQKRQEEAEERQRQRDFELRKMELELQIRETDLLREREEREANRANIDSLRNTLKDS